MQILLHLHRDEGDNAIQCQFGEASQHWGIIARWFERGCRELVVSAAPHPEGRGQHLRRDGAATCVFLTAAGCHQILLRIDGHPHLNDFSELWIWPLVAFPARRPANRATDTASPVLAG